ncbi:cytochrome P450 6B5-like [Leguminivora glycinivorella]|uniref:cytochrome P450 6B5-like n=1 Tax=Leguminivora glycinivorella TaxID=1035111 RepID=UPI0020104DF6|nr:cytochrome P450 6B5-like [Leguminivora glycinivorella]
MLTIIVVSIVFFVALYLYGTRTFNYWKNRGVKHDKPYAFYGNNFRQFVQRSSLAMTATELYRKYPNEKVIGYYRSSTPELVIRDPEIAKRIISTDFEHFYGRGLHPDKIVTEPLMKNLFFVDGDLWRLLRQRFTPAFSTGKLKAMFPLITERAEKLQQLAEEVTHLDSYDLRELMARYTTDFIGACGFGINMDSLSSENSEFRKLGKRIFQRTPRDALRGACKFMFPELCNNVHLLAPEIEESMRHLVLSVLKEKNYKPSGRNDFIDLLLELKEQGDMVGESIEKKNEDGTPIIINRALDIELMVAQVFVFFGAGFETSSSASSYLLHQLAFNPDCQVKAQEEIDRMLLKHNNKITYDAVKEMTYLEMAFNEGMRMYPPVAFIYRECKSPKYTIPEIDITIDEGVKIMIPTQAIHNDEKYFDEPEKFNPERFNPENKQNRKYIYMPFGEGPRACVGARLGQMQAMAGVAAILQKFSVEPAACSVRNPQPEPTAIVAEGFVGGLPVKLKKRIK